MATWVRGRASSLSKRWRLWADPVREKSSALRPASWVIEKNPSLLTRSLLAGGLKSSILVALAHDAPLGTSEADLARLCDVTRKAVHEALNQLEIGALVTRQRQGRSYRVALAAKPQWR